MRIDIRAEEARDILQVRDILRAAFPTDAESRLVDTLRTNDKAIISLVAVEGDQVLGHILFSPVFTTPRNQANGIGLAPVAVRTDFQKQGNGSRLIRQGLGLCKKLGYNYCVVLGDPNYYQRFGFEQASKLGLGNEYGADHEFMVIRFSGRVIEPGRVKYAPEFALFSV